MDKDKIEKMRKCGRILHEVLAELREQVRPGVTGKELDRWVREAIVRKGGEVAYDMLPKEEEFPGAICISVNDTLVHGAPKDEALKEGDKVSFDLDVFYQGWFTDSAFTMIVGGEKAGSPAVRKMISVTESAMYEGIEQVRPGAHIGDVSYAVEKVLRAGRLGVIENYIGHGIGREMHEEPEVPNYGKRGRGYALQPGDCICIEPMSCLGKPKNYVDKNDGWSVKMKDHSIGCHFEHTVLVTETGYEILT